MPGGPDQLGDRCGGRGRGTRRSPARGPQRVEPHHVQPASRQPVADHRVVDGAVALGQLDDAVELAGEADLLAQRGDAALEPERAHRDPPALARLTDHQVGGGAGAVEEDLVELRRAGELLDRAGPRRRLVHRHQQERQPVVALRARLGAGDDEAPVRHLGHRRPHLLPVDHPLVAVEPRLGLHVGEVGAGAGLGVALAPQLGDARIRGRKRSCCSGVPKAIRVGRAAPRRGG